MGFEEFLRLDRREVNKVIARNLGYLCNDSWEYNQNAMRDGKDSDSWANLTLLRHPDDKHFSHIGWNPFNHNGNAFELLTLFDLNLNLFGFDLKTAREFVVYSAYLRVKCLGREFAGVDWNKAPDWSNYWAVDSDGKAYWYRVKPTQMSIVWAIPYSCEDTTSAPKFEYSGDWKKSLTERPVNWRE